MRQTHGLLLLGVPQKGGSRSKRALGKNLSAGALTSLPSSPMTGKAGRPEWFVYDEERTADLIRVLNPNGVSPPRRTCRGTCAEARTVGRRVRDPSQGKHARRGSWGNVGQEAMSDDSLRDVGQEARELLKLAGRRIKLGPARDGPRCWI